MVFNTKAELAKRLIDGERWRVKGDNSVCRFDMEHSNPFVIRNIPMNSIWHYCDGKTEWEQVIEKKTKKVSLALFTYYDTTDANWTYPVLSEALTDFKAEYNDSYAKYHHEIPNTRYEIEIEE